jgi:endogenous inhibitor of DNA gyrase (YacG/DUF329 family)
MLEAKCAECGKKIYTTGKHGTEFCSKQCETNYNYRKKRYAGTEEKDRMTSEKAKTFK